jgi:hypothetical protein
LVPESKERDLTVTQRPDRGLVIAPKDAHR